MREWFLWVCEWFCVSFAFVALLCVVLPLVALVLVEFDVVLLETGRRLPSPFAFEFKLLEFNWRSDGLALWRSIGSRQSHSSDSSRRFDVLVDSLAV